MFTNVERSGPTKQGLRPPFTPCQPRGRDLAQGRSVYQRAHGPPAPTGNGPSVGMGWSTPVWVAPSAVGQRALGHWVESMDAGRLHRGRCPGQIGVTGLSRWRHGFESRCGPGPLSTRAAVWRDLGIRGYGSVARTLPMAEERAAGRERRRSRGLAHPTPRGRGGGSWSPGQAASACRSSSNTRRRPGSAREPAPRRPVRRLRPWRCRPSRTGGC
jgi:hypothetical protein